MKQSINIGTSANDGTGDPLRTAFDKCNDNFSELYALSGAIADITQEATFNASAAHTAIQAALDSASNSVVIVPPGSYTIGATINMVSNKKLIIQKGATITLGASVNGNMISAITIDNFVIQHDGVLSGNGDNQGTPGSGINGIYVDTCNNFAILGTGCVEDAVYNQVLLTSCVNFIVDGLTMTGRSTGLTNGLGIGGATRDGVLSNLKSYDHTGTGAESGGYGLYIAGAADVFPSALRNLKIINCSTHNTDDDGLVLFDCENVLVAGCSFVESQNDKGAHIDNCSACYFVDCDFSRNDASGASISVSGASANNILPSTFERCRFNGNGESGVLLDRKNITFLNCDFIGNTQRGVWAYYGVPENNVFDGCRVGNNGLAGIALEGAASNGAKNNTIQRCFFYDTQATKTQDYAVQEGANVGTGNRINNCVILPQQTGHLSLVNGTEGTNHLANEKLS